MRHGEDDFIDLLFAGPFDGKIEQRNQALGAFERKALGADELLPDELFEDDRVGQPGKNSNLFFAAQAQTIARTLHPFLEPVPDEAVVDVHELHADGTAIRIAQAFDDFAQRERAAGAHRFTGEAAIHVGFGESVEFGIEFWRGRAGNIQGIEPCGHVAANAVVSNELIDTFLENRARGLFRRSTVSSSTWWIEKTRRLEGRKKSLVLRKAIAFRQTLEVTAPVRGNRFRIAEVVLIQSLEKRKAHTTRKLRLAHKNRINEK